MKVIHLALVLATLALVAYSDEQGLVWVLGKKEILLEKKLRTLHYLVSGGLILIIISGLTLFSNDSSYYLDKPQFIVKMAFVFTLVINSFFIGKFSKVAITRSWKSLSPNERLPLIISGGISFLAWAGAAIGGLFIG